MNKPLTNLFELQIKSLTGFDFQDIVIKIFQYYYGITDITDIRQQKDKGCDGIIESEKRVIACFGPKENMNTIKRQKEFISKSNSDFALFVQNWQINYDYWSIVINHVIDPFYDLHVKSLNSNTSVIGLKQIINMLENIKGFQRRQLGEFLRIDHEYFANDYIKEILDDLLKEDGDYGADIKYKPKELSQIAAKIELNFSNNDIQEINTEYEEFLLQGLFSQIRSIFYGYEDNDISKIKIRVIADLNQKTNGNFKEKLNQLSDFYIEKYSHSSDDEYLYYIRGLLLYLFEQCLIGMKTKGEL